LPGDNCYRERYKGFVQKAQKEKTNMSIAIQSTLFPINPADAIHSGHEARFVATVIHNVVKDDVIKSQMPGRPIVGNKIMCGVLVWSYLNKVYSSRKIEDKILTDASFMYLSGGRDINFRTICVFRSKNTDLLRRSMVAVILCGLELNLAQIGEEYFKPASKAQSQELRYKHNLETSKEATERIMSLAASGESKHKRIKNIYSFDSAVLSNAIVFANDNWTALK